MNLTVEENVTLDFIESTYGNFDTDDVEFEENNRLLNFDNEEIFLLLIPDENDLEKSICCGRWALSSSPRFSIPPSRILGGMWLGMFKPTSRILCALI